MILGEDNGNWSTGIWKASQLKWSYLIIIMFLAESSSQVKCIIFTFYLKVKLYAFYILWNLISSETAFHFTALLSYNLVRSVSSDFLENKKKILAAVEAYLNKNIRICELWIFYWGIWDTSVHCAVLFFSPNWWDCLIIIQCEVLQQSLDVHASCVNLALRP